MAKKQITIDELAGIVKNEFEKTNKQNDRQFKELKRSIDEIKLKFAYVAWAIDLAELK